MISRCKRGTQQREGNADGPVALQILVGLIERGELLPVRGIAGEPPRKTRPGIAFVRLHGHIDLVVARERSADLRIDLGGGDGRNRGGGRKENRGL